MKTLVQIQYLGKKNLVYLKKRKEEIKMSKENRIMRMENRIKLLTDRGEIINIRLINKLKRRLRKLKGE